MVFKLLVVVLTFICLANAELVWFKLSARNLPRSDFLRRLDPYVRVYQKSRIGNFELPLGRTTTRFNNANPVWATTFNVNHRAGQNQKLHFKLFDRDAGRDDFISEGYLDLDSFAFKRSGESTMVSLPKGNLLVERV